MAAAVGACPAAARRAAAHAAHAPSAPPAARPRRQICAALRRADRGDAWMEPPIASLLRSHKSKLEHLVSTGATSAADLQPLVSELRLIADLVPPPSPTEASWGRLRDQLQSLERALAAASAPGSPASRAISGRSSAWRFSGAGGSYDGGSLAEAVAAAPAQPADQQQQQRQRRPRVTVRTRAGAALEVPLPDLDDCDALAPPQQPRLAAPGRALVCTGKKCCQQGAAATLAAAQAAARGSCVEVVATKCMGKCGQGPCVRTKVEGLDGSELVRGVAAEGAAGLLRERFGVA